MDSLKVDDFRASFCNKLQALETVVDLRDAHQDDTASCDLDELKEEIEIISNKKVISSNLLNEQKTALCSLQDHIKNLVTLKAQLRHMVENLPSRLPKQQAPVHEDRPNTHSAKPVAVVKETSACSSTTTGSAKQSSVYYPEIELLTVDEFSHVPKYLKGRFNYDSVNKFVDGMNTAFKAKYRLMWMKRSTMSDGNRKKVEAYKEQETKETQGCYFVVDEDIKDYGNAKMDSAARSILTILRHCGRVREVHGGRLTRYVYLEHY